VSPRVTRIARPPRPARPKKNPSQWAFSLNRHPAPLDPPARADRPLPSPSSVRPQGDLKKEIKKLQRFRDQVKQWAGSNDVRDKTPLLEARKLIEGKMESFKIIEKETKTKAFSKQGLEAARERKDPKEAARDEAREWLNASVDELQTQIEAFEAEIETIAEPKKSKSKTRPPRLGHLEESMSRHLQHIQRMELVLRLVDNEALAPEDVTDLKDLVDDYVERNQDDFDEFGDVEGKFISIIVRAIILMISCFVYRYVRRPRAG
jgi:CCR4-NOT transcription complex subunit 3